MQKIVENQGQKSENFKILYGKCRILAEDLFKGREQKIEALKNCVGSEALSLDDVNAKLTEWYQTWRLEDKAQLDKTENKLITNVISGKTTFTNEIQKFHELMNPSWKDFFLCKRKIPNEMQVKEYKELVTALKGTVAWLSHEEVSKEVQSLEENLINIKKRDERATRFLAYIFPVVIGVYVVVASFFMIPPPMTSAGGIILSGIFGAVVASGLYGDRLKEEYEKIEKLGKLLDKKIKEIYDLKSVSNNKG